MSGIILIEKIAFQDQGGISNTITRISMGGEEPQTRALCMYYNYCQFVVSIVLR